MHVQFVHFCALLPAPPPPLPLPLFRKSPTRKKWLARAVVIGIHHFQPCIRKRFRIFELLYAPLTPPPLPYFEGAQHKESGLQGIHSLKTII